MTDIVFQRRTSTSSDITFEPPTFVELGAFDLVFSKLPSLGTDVVFGEQPPAPLGDFDLVFGSLPTEGNDIIFGAVSDTEGSLPEIKGDLSLPLPSLSVVAAADYLRYLYPTRISLPLPSLDISVKSAYDINTFRGFARSAFQGFSESVITVSTNHSKLQESVKIVESFRTRFQEADDLVETTKQGYELSYIISNQVVTFFEDAQPLKVMTLTSSQVSELESIQTRVGFQLAQVISPSPSTVRLQEAEIVSRNYEADATLAVGISRQYGFKTKYADPYNQSFDIFYQNAEFPVNVIPPVILPPVDPVDPDLKRFDYDIVFQCIPTEDELSPSNGDITFNNCWKTKPPISVDYTEPYFVLNSIELTNLETGEAIQATSLDFSTDLSSFAWSGSMTVSADEVSKITSPTNNAVKVSLTFNGNLAVFMVKTISKTVSFNKAAYKVELISPTALLDSPYSRIDSRTVTEDIAPQSLIEPMLQTAVTGVALHWKYLSPLDWVVAANTFTYQELSPIKAIGKLLEGSAAFMYSDLDGSGLTIQRKRQVEFWEEGLNPIVLEPALVTSLSFSQERHRNFDAVYVISGLNNTLGITAHVVRDAYAGTELAPQIIAPTLTSPSAIRDAGKYCLGTVGVVETRTLSQPIIAGSPLLLPSDLVSFEQDGTTYLGTVISTGVSLKFNSQYQNFVVEVVKGFA